jgi:hypothetical protein
MQAKTLKPSGLVDEFFGTATTIGGYKKDPHEDDDHQDFITYIQEKEEGRAPVRATAENMKPSNIKVRMGLKQQKSGKLKVELPNISAAPIVNL